MEVAIIDCNAGQVRTWKQLSELIMLDKLEAAIRAYNAGQLKTWRQLSELIMLDK